MQKHKVGLVVWYTLDLSVTSYLRLAVDFEYDLCRRVDEAGMERYRAISPHDGHPLPGNKMRFEFLILAGIQAPSKKDAEAKGLTLLHKIKAAQPPLGISFIDIALAIGD